MPADAQGRPKRDILCLAAIIAAAMVLSASAVGHKSLTWDEPWYLGVGYYLVRTGDFRIDSLTSHPPLPFYVNSIPLFLYGAIGILPPNDPAFEPPAAPQHECFYCYMDTYVYRLLYWPGYRELGLMHLSRCSMLLLLAAAGAFLFRMAKDHFGTATACVLTALFCLNPNVLAHASLATTDMAPACFNLASSYYFLGFLRDRRPSRALAAGISLGLALLSNVTSAYLLPVYSITALADAFGRRAAHRPAGSFWRIILPYGLMALSALAVIDSAYLFQEVYLNPLDYSFDMAADEFRTPVSAHFLTHFNTLLYHSGIGHEGYLGGQAYSMDESLNRDWAFTLSYWATVILLKTPEGLLIIAGLCGAYYAAKAAGLLKSPAEPGVSQLGLFLWAHLAVFLLALLNMKVYLGIRLILFIFPVAFLLMGEPVRRMLSAGKSAAALLVLLSAASVLPAFTHYPDYIPYHNALVGDPIQVNRYLSDSNIDWGQDLPGLKAWMDDNKIGRIKLAYFGRDRIDKYGIEYTSLPNNQRYLNVQRPPEEGCGPTEGILAVSATSLTGQYGDPHCYDWLKAERPFATIGGSILLYNVTSPG
jgi:hypothetical protein